MKLPSTPHCSKSSKAEMALAASLMLCNLSFWSSAQQQTPVPQLPPRQAMSLSDQLAILEAKTQNLRLENGDLVFEGIDVHLRNGAGGTETVNGLGNLIIGSAQTPPGSGSHNVVLGTWNSFTSYAGLVAGIQNEISAPFATVLGGRYNKATGQAATVLGGQDLLAAGPRSSACGGQKNEAHGEGAVAVGGLRNQALGSYSVAYGGESNRAVGAHASCIGGQDNEAHGSGATICGGRTNLADQNGSVIAGGENGHTLDGPGSSLGVVVGGFGGSVDGLYSAVVGGLQNSVHADAWSVVVGGGDNSASGAEGLGVVVGGESNEVTGLQATIVGGKSNTASGTCASNSGGWNRWVSSQNSWVAGSLYEPD